MPISRSRKRPQRRPKPQTQAKEIPAPDVTVLQIHGHTVPAYRTDRCAVCGLFNNQMMVATAWKGLNGTWYAAQLCPVCIIFRMPAKTQEQRNEFYRKIELECDCFLAEQALAESEVTI